MKSLSIPDRTSEAYVRNELLLRAGEIFRQAAFRSPDCEPLHLYLPVPVVHIRIECWELGFIPRRDILGSETRGAFMYSDASRSLFGPFWCFFQHGRWELYLVSD